MRIKQNLIGRDLNTTTRSTQTQMWASWNAPTENVAQIPWEPKGNVP